MTYLFLHLKLFLIIKYHNGEILLNKKKQSKIEEIYTKSSLEFINISNSRQNKSIYTKYELIMGFLDYTQYLLNHLKDDLKTPILKKYLNPNE